MRAKRMLHEMSMKQHIPFLVCTSFFGLFLAAVIAIDPPVVANDFPLRKQVASAIFGSICTFGILATQFPRWCSRAFHLSEDFGNATIIGQYGKKPSCAGRFKVRGHHPDCGNFSEHVIKIGKGKFCSGCTGLCLGAIAALVATFAYALNLLQTDLYAVFFGILGTSLGLLQSTHPLNLKIKSNLRLFSNFCLVLGSCLIFIGVDSAARSFEIDSFLILLIIFWIVTRISLSQWNHEKICKTCGNAMAVSASPELVKRSDDDQKPEDD